jgi:chemotaxis protein MotB
VQFGDLMSLLLCFFVLLLSMATMDVKKVEEYFEIMKRSMGFLSGAENTAEADQVRLSKTYNHASDMGNEGDEGGGSDNGEMIEEVKDIAAEFNENNTQDQEIIVNVKNNNEFTLDIPASLAFEEGSYQITDTNAKKFLRRVARVIRTMSNRMDIEVVGYSSEDEVISEDIPRDSWDLSALRSIAIVKELIKDKIDPSTLKVSAYGSSRLQSDLAQDNRKIELRFVSRKNEEEILQNENFFDRIGVKNGK